MHFSQIPNGNQRTYDVLRCFRREAKPSIFTMVRRPTQITKKHIQFIEKHPIFDRTHVFSRVFRAALKHHYLRWFRAIHTNFQGCVFCRYARSPPPPSTSHIFHEFNAEIDRKYSVFSCFIGGARTSLFTTLSKHGENVGKTPANLSSIIGKWAGDWVAVWGWLGWLTGLAGLAGWLDGSISKENIYAYCMHFHEVSTSIRMHG